MSEKLKQRFKDLSITPPPSVWETIAGHLETSHENSELADRIHSVSITPPVDAWNNIALVLREEAMSTLHKSRWPAGRIIGRVAVVAGVVILGSMMWLMQGNRKQDSSPVVADSREVNESSPVVATNVKKREVKVSALPKMASLYSALGFKKKSSATRPLAKTSVTVEEPVEVPEVSIPARPIRDESGEIIQYINLADGLASRYVNVTGPNGQQTKISAKFANLLFYLNDDDDTDETEGVFTRTFLESLLWKSRFQSWKDAISQTAYIPSSTNFMDILEFKDLILQEKDIN